MEVRVVFLDVVALLVWAFGCLTFLGMYGFHILLSGFGVVFGLV